MSRPAPSTMSIYLASNSPRRRELLHQIHVRHEALLFRGPGRKTTTSTRTSAPADAFTYVQRVAHAKAEGRHPAHALARPAAAAAAGRRHHPSNSTARSSASRQRTHAPGRSCAGSPGAPTRCHRRRAHRRHRFAQRLSVSQVRFRRLGDEEIHHHVSSGERRQGRRLRHPGARRDVHRGDPRQLQRHHGPAPVRDHAALLQGFGYLLTARRPWPAPQPGSRPHTPPAGAPNTNRARRLPAGAADTPPEKWRSVMARQRARHHPSPFTSATMSDEYLINFTPGNQVALMQQGVVQEVHVERSASRGIVGNIYLGRVVRVLPGMQSAFMDVGLERTAFLHVADIWCDRHAGDAPRPIERILAEGQNLMVQVLKDPLGTKGARLSTQISIAGRMLVFLPRTSIGISQRIGDEAEREALREQVFLLPADETGGFIVRTMAENASDEELAADIAYLKKLWAEIARTAPSAPARPRCCTRTSTCPAGAARPGHRRHHPHRRRLRENFQKLSAFASEYMPQVAPLLEHYTGERPLFDLHGVEAEIEKAWPGGRPRKSGGYLIIDQTEAMTTIDVNTGGFCRRPQLRRHHLQDQPRGGPVHRPPAAGAQPGRHIIVDFIDMENPSTAAPSARRVPQRPSPATTPR